MDGKLTTATGDPAVGGATRAAQAVEGGSFAKASALLHGTACWDFAGISFLDGAAEAAGAEGVAAAAEVA